MRCTLILRRSRLIIKGMMHAATTRRSRIHKGPSTRTRGSPHVWFFTVMLRDPETALLTQGTMNVADEGKVAAVTTLRQTVKQQTAKEMLTCVQACRHLPAYGRHWKEPRSRLVFASGKTAHKLKKAQNGEPYLRHPCGVHSDGRAALARSAQTGVNQACPPPCVGVNCSARPCAAATWQDKGLMSCRHWKRRGKKTWRN